MGVVRLSCWKIDRVGCTKMWIFNLGFGIGGFGNLGIWEFGNLGVWEFGNRKSGFGFVWGILGRSGIGTDWWDWDWDWD